jgi:ribosome maturation factor RimP
VAGPAALFAFWDTTLAREPTEHPSIEQRLIALIEPALTHMGYELVRVMVMGRDRLTVQIMADRADGAQISIEDCELISHQVSAIVDVDDPIPGHWNLEVSSAGIDRPLTRAKDWARFAGHRARAESRMPLDGRKRFSGVILGADDTAARLRLDDGAEVTLPYAELRSAKLVLTDALIAATAGTGKTN